MERERHFVAVDLLADNTVADPVGAEADDQDDKEATAVGRRTEKVEIRGLLVGLLRVERSLDFFDLVQNKWVVGAAIGVVLGKDRHSTFLLTLAHEVTWALGNVNEDQDDDKWAGKLKQGGESPRPGAGM